MNDTDLLINRAKGNSFHWHQLSLRDAVTPGSSTYLFSDPQGVRLTFNSTGTITADASYDAYGQVIAGGLSNVTPFGYAGGYTDPTGLIYLVNRYYDPSTGQFLSVDPLVGITDQPYQYAGGDPLNFIDPLGLCSWYNLYCSVVQPIIHSPVYTWLNENLNPAYMALMGYYNEAQAAENGCSFWTVAKYGAEGVFGVVGTGAIAVGGVAAVADQSLGNIAYGSRLVGPDSYLFGNSTLGETDVSGILNQQGSTWRLGWSVDGTVSPAVPGFRLDTPFMDHSWWFHADGF